MSRQDDAGDALADTGATGERSSKADEYDMTARILDPGEEREPLAVISNVTDDAAQDALLMPSSPDTSTDRATEGEQKSGKLRGGFDAREAALLRWEKSRARDAARQEGEADQHSDDVVWVRVPVRTGAIIARLAKDAKGGSTGAARELRSWLTEVAQDEENSVTALDLRTRRRVLDKVLADLAEEDERVFDAEAEGATPAQGGTPVGVVRGAPHTLDTPETAHDTPTATTTPDTPAQPQLSFE